MSTERDEEISLGVEGLSYIKGSNTILLHGQSLTLNLLRVFMSDRMKGVPMEELSKPEHGEALKEAISEITAYGRDLNINSSDLAE